MAEPIFRFVAAPDALAGAPSGWAAEMLRDGEVALLAGNGLDAVDRLAHELGRPAIQIIRSEPEAGAQDETVIAYAASLPLVWVAAAFSPPVQSWARQRGPMTLLLEAERALSDDERRRIDRFVALLGRQSE